MTSDVSETDGKEVDLVTVDTDTQAELAQKYDVRCYYYQPSLKCFCRFPDLNYSCRLPLAGKCLDSRTAYRDGVQGRQATGPLRWCHPAT